MESLAKIPVFVFPNNLKFYLAARNTHKLLVTLYNPYDFRVRFTVLSTAPKKYTVIDPDGSIGPHACVDIIIRHTMPTPSNCNVTDKFRVLMHDHTTKKVLGKRDINARLLDGEPENVTSEGDNFHSMPPMEATPIDQREYHSSPQNSAHYLVVFLGMLCSVALLWPTREEPQIESNFIPSYLYISNTLKLVFAYILGLITMDIGRKEILAVLLPGHPPNIQAPPEDQFLSKSCCEVSHCEPSRTKCCRMSRRYALLLAVVCIAVLSMPTISNHDPGNVGLIPRCMHIAAETKISVAFILGFVTNLLMDYLIGS